MPGFADSFWSNDYAAGLGVLFGKLQQGVVENRQVLTIARGMWSFRWPALVVAWLVSLIAVVVVFKIPDQYEASASLFQAFSLLGVLNSSSGAGSTSCQREA
jgi:hypothetical protein